jgi:beta-phosphoglucomutase family hydrolase
MRSAFPAPAAVLGLPHQVRACLFDLDGVITDTASVHAGAWKQMFDDFLAARATASGERFVPFTIEGDYHRYVDGKRRADGTRSFLASRGIELPDGAPDDPSDADTVYGLGNRKNALVQQRIEQDGVRVYDGTVRYLHAARDAGLALAVVSSSANTAQVLRVTGLERFFTARIDAQEASARQLPGKPAPDTYLAGAEALGVLPEHAAVFEDAIAGVAAGRAGHFAIVVGVDRVGQAAQLREHGADLVVDDLETLLEPQEHPPVELS